MVATVAVMRKFAGFIFGILFVGLAAATPARVDYIVDGDTFGATVMLDEDIRVPVRVRIRDIDTPEIHGKCAAERARATRAKTRLGEILPVGGIVELTNIKDDKYLGRIDANVRDANGGDVSAHMVRSGLARRYNGGKRAGWCK